MHITLICADDDIWARGMRSISAALKRAGHETTMIFAGSTKVSMDSSLIGKIALLARQSDIIGISSMSRATKQAKFIIEGLKPLKKLIVWGGIYPTINPEECAPHADLICRGEGEEFMIDLVERVAAGRTFTDIANGCYMDNGLVQLNDVRPVIENIDTLPFPDFSFENEYILDGSGVFLPNGNMRDVSSFLFSGSRGCIYNCHYCSNSQLKAIYKGKGRYARKMTVAKFVDAVKECRRLFPRAKYVYFTDEDFFARPVEEIREFADAYPKEVDLPFECMASPLQITDEKVALMVKAGMWRIDVGVESGSDDIKRRIFNRPVDNKAVIKAANALSKHSGLIIYYFFIIGNPYEQRHDLLQTIGLLRQMPSSYFLRAYDLIFMPGTQLFWRACQDGLISGLEDSGYDKDFLSGFDYRGHEWKKSNLYLNSLIALMAGKSTRFRIGFVPKIAIPILTAARFINFCDRRQVIGKTLVNLGICGLRLRRLCLVLVTKVLRNSRIAYGLKSLTKKSVSQTV